LLQQRTQIFAKLKRKLKRGEITSLDYLKQFSNLWLTYRYGIMPLVYDVRGILKAFSSPQKPERQTSRGSMSESGEAAVVYDNPTGVKLQVQVDWTHKARAGVLYTQDDDLQARLGLRLADLPVAALELVRLSFVVDWFVNVSDYLKAVTVAGRVTELAAWSTVTTEATTTLTFDSSGAVDGTKTYSGSGFKQWTWSKASSGHQLVYVLTRRHRQPATLSDIKLSPRVQLNANRIADTFALLATNLSPHKGVRL
jgi:hypothetical protein